MSLETDQVLAFRLARSGLASRAAAGPAQAAACPASDFARDGALLALAARMDGLTRAAYEEAADAGELVVAHIVRGAIHALAPGDLALYGRALLGRDDDELGQQIGRQLQRLCAEHEISPGAALEEVAAAVAEALAGGARLDKVELHAEMRKRVRAELMPWCRSCKSHHVAPMLWRFATVKAGVRLDSRRHYLLTKPGRTPAGSDAVRRFLAFYGPAKPVDFADWAGLARTHAGRLWDHVAGELAEVELVGSKAWLLAADRDALGSPPAAEGILLLPPGDPYLQKPNRALLAPDRALAKRLFRPVASPGAVLKDGRLAGMWKAKARGKRIEIAVEKLGRLGRRELEPEAGRLAELRGAESASILIA